MSGGVGSITAFTNVPPNEKEEREPKSQIQTGETNISRAPTKTQRILSLRQLNCLALIIVLASSGLVSLEDFSFVVFALLYTFFLHKFAFPPPPSSPNSPPDPPIFSRNNKLFALYFQVSAIIGLYLPIAYIFHGIYKGDKEGIKAAAAHLFLLCSQVFMEGIVFRGTFGLPIRVFVPVAYNSKRIFAIVDWLRSELEMKVERESGGSSGRRLHVGSVLAAANLVFWCYNLFGFLLPVYMPRAFKRYYSYSGYTKVS
ncbi:hypothetical protein Ancab_009754 [Ancistrocladus abbreviatus]